MLKISAYVLAFVIGSIFGTAGATECAANLAEAFDHVFVGRDRALDLHDERIEYGDAACQHVCLVNALEALRWAHGLPPLDTLALVNDLNRAHPEYRDGFSSAQQTRVMRGWLRKYGPAGFTYTKRTLKVLTTARTRGLRRVDRLGMDDVAADPRVGRVVSFGAFDDSGDPIGLHAIAVVRREADVLTVADPNVPERALRMRITPVRLTNGRSLRLLPEEPGFIDPRYGNRPLIVTGIATLAWRR